MKEKYYQIRKRLVCDLMDGECMEETDITSKLNPDCKNCRYYKKWKESCLTVREFFNKFLKVDEKDRYRS